ncbi:MAG TPA: CCA tRNA nucleotidyltransferase [Candidatus Nanoarchaeia archaeon]|nr:CCA tRNA nucleotidyltransferase [Candidatus Nanoarchaeia archaeon]
MATKNNLIQDEILTQIKPSAEEIKRFSQAAKEVIAKLNQYLPDAEAILGGSGAKDTWLRGSHDLDIFVQFNYVKYSSKSDQLSAKLGAVVKKAFPKTKIETLHGSRDYFRLAYLGHNFEIVPILALKKIEQAKNITDISPLHSKWVNRQAKGLTDEIRLAKQFCKANNLYGAESYLSGFSGYVLEILVIHYGGFTKLLQAAVRWKPKEVVDTAKHYPKGKALFNINKSKLQSPLIVVDPVDKSRNAAAALSEEKFNLFKQTVQSYLKKPSLNFFEHQEIALEKLPWKTGRVIALKIIPLPGKRDVVGMKLVKAFNFIKSKLKQFGVKESGWEWNKEVFFFLVADKKERPKVEIRVGPLVSMNEFAADFKKKNKYTYVDKGRIYARVTVVKTALKEVVKDLIKDTYFKERVAKVEIITSF